jgi:hypothetical protein
MTIEDVRSQTAELLKVDPSELDYITEDLLDQYKSKSKPVEGSDVDPEDVHTRTNWGTYGNSVTFSGNLVYWKQNKKGTPRYGCGGAENWRAGKDWCKWIIDQGRCPSGVQEKFIGNYRP